jgi:hypothetical protein
VAAAAGAAVASAWHFDVSSCCFPGDHLFRTLTLKFITLLVDLVLFGAIAAVGGLLLASDQAPQIDRGLEPNNSEVRWLENQLDGKQPALAESVSSGQLALSSRQIDLLVDRAARRIGGGRARVLLQDGTAELLASFPLRWRRGGYANVRLRWHQTPAMPVLTAVQVGGVALPAVLVQRFLRRGFDSLVWSRSLQRIELSPDGARLYGRRALLGFDSLSTSRLSDVERRRLWLRQAQLAEIIAMQARADRLELALLLSELLARGADASAPGVDAAGENRAALLVLAAYVNGNGLTPANQARFAHPRPVYLRARRDLAQHFMASAALAAEGGSALSHLLGLTKELSDAQGGSGFSFADLTANRAGIRFAELATNSAVGARHVQLLARVGFHEDAIMPRIDGLPEGMQRGALERALGAVGSQDYARLLEYIDRRIEHSALHRTAPRR